MYAFRKPFTAAEYDTVPKLWGLDYKIVLVLAQVLGYTLSKFLGIKYISEISAQRRVLAIIVLIVIAELALLGFALTPSPYNIVFLFANGLPLGMIWGLVVSFVEGRRSTEFLAACLCSSFIISSGVVKSVGLKTMTHWGVTQFWMPFVTGALFFLPLLFFVWMLSQIPQPDEKDIEHRTERVPMSAADRWRYLRQLAFGLGILIFLHMMLTAYRDVRDQFGVDVLRDFGIAGDDASDYLGYAEIPTGLAVIAMLGLTVLIVDNRRAFAVIHLLMLFGIALLGVSTAMMQANLISIRLWFMLIGTGLYFAYVPFHSILFERLIAVFRDKATIGYLIYLADATGYLASVGILIYKNFGAANLSWRQFFLAGTYGLTVVGGIVIVVSSRYFHWKSNQVDRN